VPPANSVGSPRPCGATVIRRSWVIAVIAKNEGMPSDGVPYLSVMFQVAGYEHPVLFDRTPMGSPISLKVTRQEFDSISVGDEFTFSLDGPR
jgi:hypothetical protein